MYLVAYVLNNTMTTEVTITLYVFCILSIVNSNTYNNTLEHGLFSTLSMLSMELIYRSI